MRSTNRLLNRSLFCDLSFSFSTTLPSLCRRMGCCGTSKASVYPAELVDARHHSRQIDVRLQTEHTATQQINTILLTASHESGYERLFEPMISLYGRGYTERERASHNSVIMDITLKCMK